MTRLRDIARIAMRPHGKVAFVQKITTKGVVLDVGCGNNSPERIKTQRPDLIYVGVDVGDYNQGSDVIEYADKYIITTSQDFAGTIGDFEDSFDAIICAHNLEHCESSRAVLESIISRLKIGGKLYLSFPCEESVTFPSRNGTLNFYDDKTHRQPVKLNDVISILRDADIHVDFCAKRYRPILLWLMGFILEPIGSLFRKNMPLGSTWVLYGFETIVLATRE